MSRDNQKIEELILTLRPRARFVRCKHSNEFQDGNIGSIGQFYFVSLYDEQIDSNVIRGTAGVILIDNSYLSSFAYNLQLCRLYCSKQADASDVLGLLYKHNFKKYYAEQLFHFHNNIFSRSVLLETLLFEEKLMVPVFEERKINSDLDSKAKAGANIMSNLIMFHEFGHYILKQQPGIWQDLLDKYPSELLPIYQQVVETYPAAFVVEFMCDVIAIVNTLEQIGGEQYKLDCIDSMNFGFWVFAVLSSLAKSAKSTMQELKDEQDEVDFTSIENVVRNYEYRLGKDLDFIERAKLVTQLCRALEIGYLDKNIDNARNNSAITSHEYLLNFIDQVMVSNDLQNRKMALLVSEGFHNHPDGIQFLYLRSKTYTGNIFSNTD